MSTSCNSVNFNQAPYNNNVDPNEMRPQKSPVSNQQSPVSVRSNSSNTTYYSFPPPSPQSSINIMYNTAAQNAAAQNSSIITNQRSTIINIDSDSASASIRHNNQHEITLCKVIADVIILFSYIGGTVAAGMGLNQSMIDQEQQKSNNQWPTIYMITLLSMIFPTVVQFCNTLDSLKKYLTQHRQ